MSKHVHKTYFTATYGEMVYIAHEYQDADGRPLLRGHVAGTPAKENIIFRPHELRYQPHGQTVQE